MGFSWSAGLVFGFAGCIGVCFGEKSQPAWLFAAR
jgi:hypothetical protein